MPHQFASWSEYERAIELLVNAGLIEDATKIWWDLRPSARFPTLEMRITDVCPLIEDGIAIVALYRCILRLLYRLRRQNQRWRYYPPFLVRENRWRAQRYGVEQGLVDFGKGAVVPFPFCSRSCSSSSPRTPPILAASPRSPTRAPSCNAALRPTANSRASRR